MTKNVEQCKVTIIHQAGDEVKLSHQSAQPVSSSSSPAIRFTHLLWANTMYAKGFIKAHSGTHSYWLKEPPKFGKLPEELYEKYEKQKRKTLKAALSEGINSFQHGGCKGQEYSLEELGNDFGGAQEADPCILHPFPGCQSCPQYSQAIIYPRKCYYEAQCPWPVFIMKFRLNRILKRRGRHE